MLERDERIDRLEKELSSFHSDLKYIGKNVDKMAHALEAMVTMQSDIRVIEDRAETRYKAQTAANELLHSRIDHVNMELKELKSLADNGDTIYKISIAIGKTLGGLLLTTLFGLIIWALRAQG